MALQQIKPELLNEWKKKGKLIGIWRCERCYKKIPFYKEMPLIDMIHLCWAHDHKYCPKCEKKIKGINTIKKKEEILRINHLLEKYEPPEEDWFFL